MYVVHSGRVGRGFQFASGEAVGRAHDPSPFGDATLRLQMPHLAARGIDLAALVPGLFLGTVNLRLGRRLRLARADFTAEGIDWTSGLAGAARIAPETFSFVRCCLCYEGGYHAGLIYHPHPETKPATNSHAFDVLEVLTVPIPGLAHGRPASLVCRADAFGDFQGPMT